MVTERRVLRTSSLAYTIHLPGEPALVYETQRQSIERWASISRTRVLVWYEDKSSARTQLRALLRDLVPRSRYQRRDRLRAQSRDLDEIDYVLVHSADLLADARKFQQQCEARGARVVYTSR